MLLTTPTKSSDGVDNIKKSLSAKWGLYLPPRDSSPSRRDPHALEEKIHNCLNYLFWRKGFDAGALEYALSQFERHAPAVVSKWVSKPKAERDVLPSRQLQDSKLKADFLKTRPNLAKGQMEDMMACLHESLNEVADRVKSGQSYIQPPPTEVVSSVEAIESEPTGKENRTVYRAKQLHHQKKLTQWFRSKSAPNPSIDEYSDGETEDLLKDIEMRDAPLPPALARKAILEPPHLRTPTENSPETEEFETPPTTPLRERTRVIDESVFKKPSITSLSRKRPLPDPQKSTGSQKSSRGSSSHSPGSSHKNKSGSFGLVLNESPSTSFGVENMLSSVSSSTTIGSTSTSANTSFSTALSADSRSTSFERLSDDTDKTIQAPLPKDESVSSAYPLKESEVVNKRDLSSVPENNSLKHLILDRLRIYPPFGPNLSDRSSRLPLRQLYEVTRVSLSSQISLDKFHRELEAEFTNYDHLWMAMTKIVKACQSIMPERSSLAAWEGNKHIFDEVTFSGKLRFVDDNTNGPILRFTLMPLRLEPSYRLSRQFGHDRFLIVTFPGLDGSDLPRSLRTSPLVARNALLDWLVGSHLFLGRTWRVFYHKQDRPRVTRLNSNMPRDNRHKIYMFAEDGPGFHKSPPFGEIDQRRPKEAQTLTREDMLEWFVPAVPNQSQPVLKLFKRLDLAVSKTVPTITFGPNKIYRSDDTYAHDPQPRELGSKRSDEKKRGIVSKQMDSPVMNDGCARISKAAARGIAEHLHLDQVPCAFQGRIGGAKGMWLVNAIEDENPKPQSRTINALDKHSIPPSEDSNYWIEITDSQLKFESHPLDAFCPEKRRVTFEVNDYPRKPSSSALNFQLMPILENRGVPVEVFMDFLRADLTAKVGELQAAMDSGLSLRLWNQRNNPTTEERARCDGIQFQGGLPSSRAEKINWFVEHGFEPKSCRYLKELLFQAILAYCLRLEAKMDVAVGQSTYVFMLADPLGILEEGQVHLCFSGSFYDRNSGFDEAMLHDRDCLVARLPAHLPSDIQKVRAIFKPELRIYRDVIVFPSKGTLSLASILSGGDYDGDKAWVCWEPSIVDPFRKEASVPDQPTSEKFGITKDRSTTMDFIDHKRLNTAFIRYGLDFNLRTSMLGACTHYHEAYCYKYAIDKPEAMEVAGLLGLLVDSAKAGFVFDDSTWNDYLKTNKLPRNLRKPAYKDRDRGKPTQHLIDRLVFDIAKKVREETLGHFAKRFEDVGSWDDDLVRLRNSEIEIAKNSNELNAILSYLCFELEKLFSYWKVNARPETDESEYVKPKRQAGPDEITFRAVVESCRSDFLAIAPTTGDNTIIKSDRICEWQRQHSRKKSSYWDLLKASVAFHKFHASNFVWHMAGIELGEIKAMSNGRGTYRPTVNNISNAMKIDGKTVDGIKRREDFEEDEGLNDEDEFGGWSWADDV